MRYAVSRVAQIRALLELAFNPVELDVEDDSHLHVGHAGARDGKGHFSVRIVASAFDGKSPLQRHRMVFEALGEMMVTDIHALKVSAKSPSTVSQSIQGEG
jgi:BolA protein